MRPTCVVLHLPCVAVLSCLLLRYVVDVRVSVSWRSSTWQLKTVQGVRHCSNTCYKVRSDTEHLCMGQVFTDYMAVSAGQAFLHGVLPVER
jgi:hypothetical protein